MALKADFGGARVDRDVPLASLTTLRVGPVARRVITCATADQVVATLDALDRGDILTVDRGYCLLSRSRYQQVTFYVLTLRPYHAS